MIAILKQKTGTLSNGHDSVDIVVVVVVVVIVVIVVVITCAVHTTPAPEATQKLRHH